MARRGGTMVALGAALLASGGAPAWAGAPTAGPAATSRQVLIHPRGGALERVTLKAGVDPDALVAQLRRRPDLFSSASRNLVATAAALPAAAAQAPAPGGATPAPTTPGAPAVAVVVPTPAQDGGVSPVGLKGFLPNDHVGDLPWTALQWNFAGTWGVRAPVAWANLIKRGRSHAGARHARIAVVDSGLAYRTRGVYRQSPDLVGSRILDGYDFVDNDRFPDDLSGHGTHVASTIAAATNNDAGLTGLAYAADIIPVRVLYPNEKGEDEGDEYAITRGIRYAIRRDADLINLSFDFPAGAKAADIPEVAAAIDDARRAGILVIASAGNDGGTQIALPARLPTVLAVGATTARGCRSAYSSSGPQLDLVAPGGGKDHTGDDPSGRCRPGVEGPPIAQVTLLTPNDPSTLGVPLDYVGTSMAAAHVTGVAALVRASGILGGKPSAGLLAAYLERSTRDLGTPGRDPRYGAGLIDAAAATDREGSAAAVRGAKRAASAAVARGDRTLPNP